jgi:hypothetical protein
MLITFVGCCTCKVTELKQGGRRCDHDIFYETKHRRLTVADWDTYLGALELNSLWTEPEEGGREGEWTWKQARRWGSSSIHWLKSPTFISVSEGGEWQQHWAAAASPPPRNPRNGKHAIQGPFDCLYPHHPLLWQLLTGFPFGMNIMSLGGRLIF